MLQNSFIFFFFCHKENKREKRKNKEENIADDDILEMIFVLKFIRFHSFQFIYSDNYLIKQFFMILEYV